VSQSLFGPGYTIDCCSFVALEQYSEQDRARGFAVILKLVGEQRFKTVSYLLNELEVHAHFTYNVLSAYRKLILVDEPTELWPHVGRIGRIYTEISGSGVGRGQRGDKADPWILTLARVYSLVLVTEEGREPTARKLPFACTREGVECIDVAEMLRREG
jgi:hypothetical protein